MEPIPSEIETNLECTWHRCPLEDGAIWRHILIVDDEENVALGLQEGLEGLPNCKIAAVTSGEQALYLLRQQSFDLLVTDYRMPDVDGLTLAMHVRQSCPDTAIIIMTAHASDALCERAARVPVQCILDKPVQLAAIRSTVLGALKEGRS